MCNEVGGSRLQLNLMGKNIIRKKKMKKMKREQQLKSKTDLLR